MKLYFYTAKTYYFWEGSRCFSSNSQNAAPGTIFCSDNVSCSRSPDTAIHQNSTFATWQHAAPATRKRHASIDTLLKYCACRAERTSIKTQQKQVICQKIDLQHVILITLCERRPMVISDLTANVVRTVVATETTLSEHDSNLQPSRGKREPFEKNTL